MKVNEILGKVFESAVDEKPTYKNLATKAAIDFLNAHCKDAIWMLEKNTPVYRGINDYHDPDIKTTKDFSLVDTMLTTRKSQNTSNFYTVILDNNPLNKDFPKRSKSFVGTTSIDYAHGYSNSGSDSIFVMIPTDQAKIGIVNHADIWHTRIKLFGHSMAIEQFNDEFNELFHSFFDKNNLTFYPEEVTINMFKDFDKKLKSGDIAATDTFREVFGGMAVVKGYHLRFLEEIFKAYSSEKTGHEWCYASNCPQVAFKTMTEVWISGKIVLIRLDMWRSLVEAYREKK